VDYKTTIEDNPRIRYVESIAPSSIVEYNEVAATAKTATKI